MYMLLVIEYAILNSILIPFGLLEWVQLIAWWQQALICFVDDIYLTHVRWIQQIRYVCEWERQDSGSAENGGVSR